MDHTRWKVVWIPILLVSNILFQTYFKVLSYNTGLLIWSRPSSWHLNNSLDEQNFAFVLCMLKLMKDLWPTNSGWKWTCPKECRRFEVWLSFVHFWICSSFPQRSCQPTIHEKHLLRRDGSMNVSHVFRHWSQVENHYLYGRTSPFDWTLPSLQQSANADLCSFVISPSSFPSFRTLVPFQCGNLQLL